MHAFPTLQAIFWAFSMCTVGTHIAVDAFTLSRDHVAEPIIRAIGWAFPQLAQLSNERILALASRTFRGAGTFPIAITISRTPLHSTIFTDKAWRALTFSPLQIALALPIAVVWACIMLTLFAEV